MTENKPPRSVPQMIFAYVAVGTGTMAFLQAGIKGHRAGWEEMMIYSAPAVVCALLAIGIRRNKLGFAALLFGVLAAIGFVLGA